MNYWIICYIIIFLIGSLIGYKQGEVSYFFKKCTSKMMQIKVHR